MSAVAEALSHGFIQNAVAAGLVASVLCGVLGTFVVVKRLVFLGGGVSHAAFAGLGACHLAGWPPLAGAAAVAVLAAVVLGGGPPTGAPASKSRDAGIGILWAVGMAVGVVLISRAPGYTPDLMTYLFGNILLVSRSDVLVGAGFAALLLALLALAYEEFVAVAFDEEFAAVQGLPVRRIMTLLLVVTSLALVYLIQLVGIILVMALLTIPPVVSLRLVRGFGATMALSTLIGALMTLGGLAVSYAWDLPSGPAIVLLGAVGLLVVGATGRLVGRHRPE